MVWDTIALHTTPEIPWHNRPEIALVNGGAAVDVVGAGLDEIPLGDGYQAAIINYGFIADAGLTSDEAVAAMR